MNSRFKSDEWEVERNGLSRLLATSLKEPILGKHFALPGRTAEGQHIELDTSQSYIAVYTHLKVHATKMLERLPTPEAIVRLQAEIQANSEGKPKTRAAKPRCDLSQL
ncbi:WD repeat-containing protein on Y chromosome [Drosophila ficusphila]|uniref:WD repeat-containing protein on Y chromosome n=1 Tax=Drosophila ficusphila TaxID=30025 RepID=UPI0007E689EA|nr:WD repeat-containing protein on Y chromosome [Drosophila ficusphila]